MSTVYELEHSMVQQPGGYAAATSLDGKFLVRSIPVDKWQGWKLRFYRMQYNVRVDLSNGDWKWQVVSKQAFRQAVGA